MALGKTTTYVAFLYHSSSASTSVSALLPHRTINGVIHHRDYGEMLATQHTIYKGKEEIEHDDADFHHSD